MAASENKTRETSKSTAMQDVKTSKYPLLFIAFYNVDLVRESLESMVLRYGDPKNLPYDIYISLKTQVLTRIKWKSIYSK